MILSHFVFQNKGYKLINIIIIIIYKRNKDVMVPVQDWYFNSGQQRNHSY